MNTVALSRVNLALVGLVSGTVGLLTPSQAIAMMNLVNATPGSGTGAGNLNQFYQTQTTLAASATIDYDLYAWGGALDISGTALTMAKIKLLVIQNLGVVAAPVEADSLIIGGKGATSGWTSYFGTNTDTGKILSPASVAATPGTFFLCNLGVGYTVGNSTTNHLLTLTAGSNTGAVTYNIIAFGATS